ncbi:MULTISPECIES: hypothetical protein [unclassified Janthinobacterium]|uniref:hypothetical protein n=1 Tax=unclassified Janthinobacterium TaxID=2610881 RepID=UPI00161CDFC2|nr:MULTISPECIES: hypothetical protein [unclassified Janthinobacterium]MBB5371138.1 hypothetical protein [Janthinobacterium sp. K2C7]MBB5383944.1 hypothetical protein [Janthinobacterium sp. K2Li3]MBB5389234.1 hypothetical protein [Janthinobacterium sp. K2E3]
MKSSCLRPLLALLITVGLAACGGKATYDVSGTIIGLNNSGLVLANGADTLSVPAGATTFTFANKIDYGASYNIVVQTPPAHMNCTVVGGSDTAGHYVSIQASVSCQQNVYTVGGTVTGLTVDGLQLSNGSDILTLTKNTAADPLAFTMPTAVPDGRAFGISVTANPTGLACSVLPDPTTGLSSGVGIMGAAAVTSVKVACNPA